MKRTRRVITGLLVSFAALGLTVLLSAPAYAHCDGLDGPVVKAAQAGKATRGGLPEPSGETGSLLREIRSHTETGPSLSAGDLDADWQRAWSSGEEAAGGSAPTPDQNMIDEIGRAFGVESGLDAPVRTSDEILGDRDARYWPLDRRASRKEQHA
jgi:hypothetical protein